MSFFNVFVANAVFYDVLNALLLNSCSGGPRRLWMSGSALAELWEALGELWEVLYIEKLPINRPSGRYVIFNIIFHICSNVFSNPLA